MKHKISYLLLVLFTGLSANLTAQIVTNKGVEATYRREADFFLKYAKDDAGISVKLKASYDQKEKLYVVKIIRSGKEEELLQMSDPLSYEYFNTAFFDSLKKKIPEIKPLSSMASRSVFTWLYTLSAGNEDDIVNSGVLWLRNWGMIFGKEKKNEKYTKVLTRERFLDSISNELQSQQAYVASLKKDVQKIFDKKMQAELRDTVDKKEKYTLAIKTSEITSLKIQQETRTKDLLSKDIVNLKTEYGITDTQYSAIAGKINEKKAELERTKSSFVEDAARKHEIVSRSDTAVLRQLKQKASDARKAITDTAKKYSISDPSYRKILDILFDIRKRIQADTTQEGKADKIANIERDIQTVTSDTILVNSLETGIRNIDESNDKIRYAELTVVRLYSDSVGIYAADTTVKKLDGVQLQNEAEVKIAKKALDDAVRAFNDNSRDFEKFEEVLRNVNADVYKNAGALWAQLGSINAKRLSSADTQTIENYLLKRAEFHSVQKMLNLFNVRLIQKVSLQFERGYLERIQVWVSNDYRSDIYENIYAIGMSSINNLKAFNTTCLFIRKSAKNNGSSDYIMLSDVIGNYDNFLALFTRDYSPGDTEINYVDPLSNPCLILKKERLVNRFDTKIYTDFAGLKEGSPNGLVQLDASRRFNLNNFRDQIKGSRSDFGFFDNITVFGAITKVEQKERRLMLRNENAILNNKIVSPSYVSTLDLRQYENASIGADMNLGLFDYPDGKFTMFLNLGLRYGHTPLEDSIRTLKNNRPDTPGLAMNLEAHSFTWQPKLSVEFFAERRVGLILSYQYNMARYYTNNAFKPIMSYGKSDLVALPLEKYAGKYHMYELFLRIETSRANNGRMFLRARYFMQRGDVNTFFPQVQLGYAYNLVFRK